MLPLKILIPWQHRDYRTLTALSLGLRPRESGQLSTIIPHNHGITITYTKISMRVQQCVGFARSQLEKWFPLHGERDHSLYFCIYIRRLEVSKNNRNVKEEETEQTY